MLLLSLLRLRATFLGFCVFSSVSLCLCGSTSAALDAETKKPYQVTVVLHVAEHRLLTPVFRDRIEREVHDGLQAALGDLAEVKVVREHPKLAEVLEKGLRSLDGWNDRTPVKTHFVLVDFADNQYEMQARQYDGQIGMATPVVRREKTQDREFVARTIVLMIERDFGISATFQTWPKGKKLPKPQKVQLELKGGGLDAPLNRWVQKGDVFAVVAIPTGNGIGRVVPDAIVQIEKPPGEGGATCDGNLFWRRELSSSAGIAGYRCVKLGVMKGPLQVRLVQAGGELLGTPTLLVGHHGFSGENETLLDVRSHISKANAFDTGKLGDKGQFDGVAFVTVMLNGKPRAEIPIVLLDDQQVVVPVSLSDDDKTTAERSKEYWKKDVVDSYRVQAGAFTELQQLSEKKETPRAVLIAKAKEAAERSTTDRLRLQEERKELYGDGPGQTDADRRDLAQAEQRLQDIRKGADELLKYADQQAKIETEEKDPKRQRWQEEIQRGGLLERDGELKKAIDVYQAILKEGFQSPELEAKIKQLQALWEPKSEAHKQARDYIYNVWPKLDTAALQTQVATARAALAECKKVGDYVGPQKLYNGIQLHAARMLKEAEGLRDINEEEAKQLKVLHDIGVDLGKLEAEIKEYLDKAPK